MILVGQPTSNPRSNFIGQTAIEVIKVSLSNRVPSFFMGHWAAERCGARMPNGMQMSLGIGRLHNRITVTLLLLL